MKFANLASRVAVGGVATALATAGLVAATGTTASAAPVSTTYTCTAPIGQTSRSAVTVDIALLPPTAPAGFPVPAGLFGFNSTPTIDNATADRSSTTVGVTGAKSDDFGTAFGDTVAKAPVVWTKPAAAATPPTRRLHRQGRQRRVHAAQGRHLRGGHAEDRSPSIATNASGGNGRHGPLHHRGAGDQIGTITLEKQASKVKARPRSRSSRARSCP